MNTEILLINCGSEKTIFIESALCKQGVVCEVLYLFRNNYVNHKEFLELELPNHSEEFMFLRKHNDKVEKVELKTVMKSYDGIVLSGGGVIKDNIKEYKYIFSALQTYNNPMFGICFGHQILGLINGAKLMQLDRKVSGNFHISIADDRDNLFENVDGTVKFLQNHSEVISLPNNFRMLAYSEYGLEAMKCELKDIYGVQFHPEVSGSSGDAIISNFVKIVKRNKMKELFRTIVDTFKGHDADRNTLYSNLDMLREKSFNPIIDSLVDRDTAIDLPYLKKVVKIIGDATCPIDIDGIVKELELITIPYYSFDNQIHVGQVVVNESIVEDLIDFLELAFIYRFPFGKMIPLSDKQFWDPAAKMWSDIISMNENNCSGFNLRRIAGTDKLSKHSYGMAVDFNPMLNPCFYLEDHTQEPIKGNYDINQSGTFTDNEEGNPIGYKLTNFLIERNWIWGGNWNTLKDNHHFQK